MRRIIYANGTWVDLTRPYSFNDLQPLLGAHTFDVVALHHLGDPLQVMIVDDTGVIDGKPVNLEATKLYQQSFRTTNQIHGDVAIMPDKDFS